MRETRTPYSKPKLKQKERRNNEKKKQINPNSSDRKGARSNRRSCEESEKNRTEYLISAALGKEITVIEDLREMIVQLKKIGNNLNQLTRKANAHEIEVVNLTETKMHRRLKKPAVQK